MYQALYRKWRPRTFSDVIGQDQISRTLQKQAAENRTSHAYLFTGTRGTGKTSCAKILAKAVNCEHPVNGDPCGVCPACRGIENGSFLDVLELDAASNNGVDQVRALRDEAIYAPAHVKKRVYIIDEVHMLSMAAFNALLKILEEPPEHLMFILATTELHKVPATILSRCQRFSFRRITPGDIAARLRFVAEQEQIPLTDDGAELLSRLADGALRDALSLLDQCAAVGGVVDASAVLETLGLTGNLQTAQLMECILRRDAAAALELCGRLYDGGKDMGAVLGELSALTRDLLLRQTVPSGGEVLLSGGYDAALLDRLCKGVSGTRFLYMASILQKTAADLTYSTNRRTDVELCLLRLCDESLSNGLAALTARVERLEERFTQGVPLQTPAPAAPPERPERVDWAVSEADRPPWDTDEERPPLPEVPPPLPEESYQWVLDVPASEPPPLPEVPAPEKSAAKPSKPAKTTKSSKPPKAAKAAKSKDAEAAPVSGGSWWRDLIERCKPRLPKMYGPFLKMCSGTLSGDLLTVYVADDLTLNRLDNDRIRGVFSEEAEQAAGGPVRLSFRVGAPPQISTEENFQNLLKTSSQFDNVEIN